MCRWDCKSECVCMRTGSSKAKRALVARLVMTDLTRARLRSRCSWRVWSQKRESTLRATHETAIVVRSAHTQFRNKKKTHTHLGAL